MCWLLGLLAVDCLRDAVLDGHAFFCLCRQHLGNTGLCGLGYLVCWLLASLMGGWMDGL